MSLTRTHPCSLLTPECSAYKTPPSSRTNIAGANLKRKIRYDDLYSAQWIINNLAQTKTPCMFDAEHKQNKSKIIFIL